MEDQTHTQDTPARVERLWTEVLWGLDTPKPKATAFDNEDQVDQLMTIGPITIRSCCAHHLVPVMGSAWVGYIPGKSLLGLSKFHRLAQWHFARPTVQEVATKRYADDLHKILNPAGLGVIVRCQHFCVAWRGVKGDGSFVTSDLRANIRDDAAARSEFMGFVRGQDF
jgi:GTP cyclohydrolase I